MVFDKDKLEKKIKQGRFSELSDKELEEQAQEQLGKAGVGNKSKPDLEAYQQARADEIQKERYAGMGTIEKFIEKTKDLFSPSEKALYTRTLRRIEQKHAVYTSKVNKLEEMYETQNTNLNKLSDRRVNARSGAELLLENYQRTTHRLERAQEELESLVETTGSPYTAESREKREQVRTLRQHQRSLYNNTSKAMLGYRRISHKERALESRQEHLGELLSTFQRQSDSVEIVLQDRQLEKEMLFAEDGVNLHELYEELAIDVQKMNHIVENGSINYQQPGTQKEFEVEIDVAKEEDDLLKKWYKTPSP